MDLDLITFGVFESVAEILLATGTILGLTALLGKLIPENIRDKVLPPSACFMGVLLAVSSQLSHGDMVTVTGIMVGIVFGGSVTGLYSVAKDLKQTPNVVVNK